MRPLPQKPINSSSFYAIPSHLCRWKSNLSVGATFLSIKQVSLHTTRVPHFSSSLSPLHTHNFSHFTSFFCPFLSQGQKPFNQAILPSSAPHLEKQHQGTLQELQHQFCFKGFSFLILCSLMLFIFMLNLCKHEV